MLIWAGSGRVEERRPTNRPMVVILYCENTFECEVRLVRGKDEGSSRQLDMLSADFRLSKKALEKCVIGAKK